MILRKEITLTRRVFFFGGGGIFSFFFVCLFFVESSVDAMLGIVSSVNAMLGIVSSVNAMLGIVSSVNAMLGIVSSVNAMLGIVSSVNAMLGIVSPVNAMLDIVSSVNAMLGIVSSVNAMLGIVKNGKMSLFKKNLKVLSFLFSFSRKFSFLLHSVNTDTSSYVCLFPRKMYSHRNHSVAIYLLFGKQSWCEQLSLRSFFFFIDNRSDDDTNRWSLRGGLIWGSNWIVAFSSYTRTITTWAGLMQIFLRCQPVTVFDWSNRFLHRHILVPSRPGQSDTKFRTLSMCGGSVVVYD